MSTITVRFSHPMNQEEEEFFKRCHTQSAISVLGYRYHPKSISISYPDYAANKFREARQMVSAGIYPQETIIDIEMEYKNSAIYEIELCSLPKKK